MTDVRESQAGVEVLYQPDPAVQVTQAGVEVLMGPVQVADADFDVTWID